MGKIFAEKAQRFIYAEFFFRLHAIIRPPAQVLACDGAVNSGHGCIRFHRRIRASCKEQVICKIGVPEVAVLFPYRPQALLHPVHIREEKDRLDIQHNRQLPHAPDEFRRGKLGVDNAEFGQSVHLLLRPSFREEGGTGMFDCCDHHVQSPVADGMHGALDACAGSAKHFLFQSILIFNYNTCCAGVVRIGGIQCRAAGTEAPVAKKLIASYIYFRMRIIQRNRRRHRLILQLFQLVLIDSDPEGEKAVPVERCIVFRRLGVFPDIGGIGMHGCHTQRSHFLQLLHHDGALASGIDEGIRYDFIENFRRLFPKDTIRIAVRFKFCRAARFRRVPFADPCFFQSGSVCHRRVQTGSLNDDGMLGAGGIQIMAGWQLVSRVCPFGLIEVRPADPFALRCCRGFFPKPRDSLRLGDATTKVNRGQRLAEGIKMHVTVSETGNNGLSAEVDGFPRIIMRKGFLVSPGKNDLAVLNAQRFYYVSFIFQRMDAAVVKQPVQHFFHDQILWQIRYASSLAPGFCF